MLPDANEIKAFPSCVILYRRIHDFEANNYWCLYASVGTDENIIEKLQESPAHAVEEPDLRNHFLATGLTPVGSTSHALASRVDADSAKWVKVISSLRLRTQK
jgi:tripartite-type tricarboxylate transporter receptor subunit TctC